jgi:hypothetical protein
MVDSICTRPHTSDTEKEPQMQTSTGDSVLAQSEKIEADPNKNHLVRLDVSCNLFVKGDEVADVVQDLVFPLVVFVNGYKVALVREDEPEDQMEYIKAQLNIQE